MATAKRASYEDVLSDLKEERKELMEKIQMLNNAISFIENRRKEVIESQSLIFEETTTALFKKNAFSGLTVSDAAIKYLTAVGKPISTGRLIDGILEYGYQSNAKNKRHSIRNTLIYLAEDERSDIIRTPDNTWYLKSWDWYKPENPED